MRINKNTKFRIKKYWAELNNEWIYMPQYSVSKRSWFKLKDEWHDYLIFGKTSEEDAREVIERIRTNFAKSLEIEYIYVE